ncbi:MAG TPA: DegT/DnrJ/EryC1/StrS family aminotransferase [bacterium]|nr:DegT/DnrJ/EryC1/StrS family aminotransferase [bacterium]
MGKLAVNGGTPVRTKPFPSWPVFGDKEEKALVEVLRSGSWGLPGIKAREFEQKFSAFQHAEFGVACCNGTIAIEIALLALGVGAGHEVIVPPYTFMATATAVVTVNAIPVFVDIDPDTCNISPEAIEKAITPHTKAIIVVHVAGCPCDMDAILAIANKHGLKVIEDSAHAHGAEWKGKRVGALGDMGTFSFQSSKNLTSGEGGIIVTNNPELADLAESIHNCGRAKGKGWYEHFQIGANYRLSEFQAAILLCGLERLPEKMAIRERNGALLDKGLAQIPGVAPQKRDPRVTSHGHHLYMARFPQQDREGIPLARIIQALNAEGFPCSTGYNPLYKLALYSEAHFGPHGCPISCPFHKGTKPDYSKIMLPEAEKAADEIVWSHHPVLLGSAEDTQDIVDAVAKVMENKGELIA